MSGQCSERSWALISGLLELVADKRDPYSLSDDITTDGVHFNHRGYEMIGKHLADHLRPTVAKGGTVLLFGDSITAGYPYFEPVLAPGQGDPTHSFGHWLETLLGVKVVNRGISGDTTEGMLQRFREETVSGDTAIFQGGGNDVIEYMFASAGPLIVEHILGNFEGMGREAMRRGLRPVFLPLLPFDPCWG